MLLFIRKKCIFVNVNFSACKTCQFLNDKVTEISNFRFRIKSLKFRLDIKYGSLHGTKI